MTTPCQCPGPGKCPVFGGRRMDATLHRLCSTEPGYYETFAKEAEARAERRKTRRPMPSLPRRAVTLAKAVGRAAKAAAKGKPLTVSADVLAARKEACRTCDKKQGGWCGVCGCALGAKQKVATESCPLGRWPKAGPTPPEFVTLATLAADTLSLIPRLPPDVSVVVGVARSGMAPASLLAMYLHKPLYAMTKDGIVDCGHGWRLGTGKPHGADVAAGTAVIVDDTVMLGGSLKHARNIAAKHFAKRLHANVYVNPAAKVRPDLWARLLPAPHLLEWNLFNSLYLSYAAFDFDGVFCRDFTPQEDDDGDRYLAAMADMPPLYLPRKAPVHIVTARLEKHRQPTLAWLARWGVQVASLTMGPWATKAERQRSSVAAWKAGEVRRLFATMRPNRRFGGPLFVESCPKQAEEIARLSGYLVVCPTSQRAYR